MDPAFTGRRRDKDVLKACHVPSANNLADIFTKILGVETFRTLRDQILYRLPLTSSDTEASERAIANKKG